MFNRLRFAMPSFDHAFSRLDFLLYAFSTYTLPIAIAALSAIALFTWGSPYDSGTPHDVKFQYLKEDSGTPRTPGQAAAILKTREFVSFVDTDRSESPFWFAFV